MRLNSALFISNDSPPDCKPCEFLSPPRLSMLAKCFRVSRTGVASSAVPTRSDWERSMSDANSESVAKLCRLLSIPEDLHAQDWGVEYADSGRIGEFVARYKDSVQTPEERQALMSLIIASLDWLIDEGCGNVESEWAEIRPLINGSRDEFAGLIEYYRCTDAKAEDEQFAVTRLFRQLK